MARPARPMDPERRTALIDSAATAFVDHGYEAASLNGILAEAGVAKSSLYHHVGGKEDLFGLVLADRLAVLWSLVSLPDVDSLKAQSFWPTIEAGLADLGRAAMTDPRSVEAGRLVHLRDAPAVPAMVAFRHDLTTWFDTALARGRDLGVIDTQTPPDLQRSLVVAVAVEVDRWVLAQDTDDPGVHARPAAILHRLLAPQVGGSP